MSVLMTHSFDEIQLVGMHIPVAQTGRLDEQQLQFYEQFFEMLTSCVPEPGPRRLIRFESQPAQGAGTIFIGIQSNSPPPRPGEIWILGHNHLTVIAADGSAQVHTITFNQLNTFYPHTCVPIQFTDEAQGVWQLTAHAWYAPGHPPPPDTVALHSYSA